MTVHVCFEGIVNGYYYEFLSLQTGETITTTWTVKTVGASTTSTATVVTSTTTTVATTTSGTTSTASVTVVSTPVIDDVDPAGTAPPGHAATTATTTTAADDATTEGYHGATLPVWVGVGITALLLLPAAVVGVVCLLWRMRRRVPDPE